MDTRYDQIQAGWSAYGSDGDKIGDIEEVGPDYLLVTKGLIFTTDLYVPLGAISEVDPSEGRVHLTVAKSEVEDQGWTEPRSKGGDLSSEGRMDVDSQRYGEPGREGEISTASLGGYDTSTTDATDSDRIRVPLHQEELRAERTTETAGEVRVDKNVIEEEQTLDVPVTREQVEVRRVATDRRVGADEGAFTGDDTIRVPVSAERVQVTKEPRVVEEIEISKRSVTENQRVSDTVRREEIDIEESGNVLAGAGASMSGTGHDVDRVGETTFDEDDDLTTRR